MIGLWALAIGTIIFGTVFWFWRQDHSVPEPASPGQTAPAWLHSVLLLFFGVLGMIAGVVAYAIVIQTNGFTFNFQRPIWRDVKAKIYLANIVVPSIFIIGAGLFLAAFVAPLLEALGLSKNLAWLIPLIGSLVVLQIALVWVNLWAPLEKRLINKRLAAKGIVPEQAQHGCLIGLSDPTRSSLKKIVIEDDIGMLWMDAQRLVYFGDQEHFSFSPEQVLSAERKIDAASNTALSGTSHLILRVRQPDGTERQIRLHTEGVWTLGQKRSAMDALAYRINTWLGAAEPRAAQ
jgi:hypothetical protein